MFRLSVAAEEKPRDSHQLRTYARPKRNSATRCVVAAAEEANLSEGLASEGIKDRAVALISPIEAHDGRKMLRGTGVLAAVGASPELKD